jgi:hypothetical protein
MVDNVPAEFLTNFLGRFPNAVLVADVEIDKLDCTGEVTSFENLHGDLALVAGAAA